MTRRLAPALALILAWLAVSWVPLGRVALSDDEAIPSEAAYHWIQHGHAEWMISPYTGSAKAMIIYAVRGLVPISVRLARAVTLALGAALALLIYAMADEYAGAAAAAPAAALTLMAPEFFVLARYDVTCGTIGLMLMILGALAFLRWWRSGASWLACAGAALCGLAIWTHLLLAAPIGAAVASVLLLRARETRERLSRRPWLVLGMGGAFLFGLWPLLAHFYPSVLIMKSGQLGSGRPWWRMALDNGLAIQGAWSGVSARVSLLREPAGGSSLLAWALLAAYASAWAGLDRVWRRRLALPWLQVLLCAAGVMAFVPLQDHHVPLLFAPWLSLTLGVGCAGLWAGKSRPALKLTLSVPVVACLVLSGQGLWALSAGIRSGDISVWRDGRNLDELGGFLKTRTEELVPLDYGLLCVIPALTNGRCRIDPDAGRQFWTAADGRRELSPRLLGPDRLFLLHPPCGMHFPGARRALWRAARAAGWKMSLVRRIGSGPSAIEVYAVVRGKMPLDEPERQIPASDDPACGDWGPPLPARKGVEIPG